MEDTQEIFEDNDLETKEMWVRENSAACAKFLAWCLANKRSIPFIRGIHETTNIGIYEAKLAWDILWNANQGKHITNSIDMKEGESIQTITISLNS